MERPSVDDAPIVTRPGSVAFLGLCDGYNKLPVPGMPTAYLNLFGLRKEVISPIYPTNLSPHVLALAIHDIRSNTDLDIRGRYDGGGEAFNVTLTHRMESVTDLGHRPTDHSQIVIEDVPAWTPLIAPFPPPGPTIVAPGRVTVSRRTPEGDEDLGHLLFLYAQAAPLTPERIAAIKATPRASRFVRIDLGCRLCNAHFRAYAGLERSEKCEREGFMWQPDVPDSFVCKCGTQSMDLKYIRESLHGLLGRSIGKLGNHLSATGLYHASRLAEIGDEMARLLAEDPEEPAVQEFLQQHPIAFHRFTPEKLLFKAPLLNKYATDFAVLSTTGELYLIEIEKPSKPVTKKDGGRTAYFTQALEQLQNWLDLFARQRSACLECMNLVHDKVTTVRGILIMGRDSGSDGPMLRRIKGADYGQVFFLTYDDLLSGIDSLAREMRLPRFELRDDDHDDD